MLFYHPVDIIYGILTYIDSVGIDEVPDGGYGLDGNAAADDRHAEPVVAAQPLPQQGDGEQGAEDDGGHAQHLEESSVLHEAEADVAQHRAHQLYHCGLKMEGLF